MGPILAVALLVVFALIMVGAVVGVASSLGKRHSTVGASGHRSRPGSAGKSRKRR